MMHGQKNIKLYVTWHCLSCCHFKHIDQ